MVQDKRCGQSNLNYNEKNDLMCYNGHCTNNIVDYTD